MVQAGVGVMGWGWGDWCGGARTGRSMESCKESWPVMK